MNGEKWVGDGGAKREKKTRPGKKACSDALPNIKHFVWLTYHNYNAYELKKSKITIAIYW